MRTLVERVGMSALCQFWTFAGVLGDAISNLIKPLRMLRDGGDADEENQDADDVSLEP
jgi:hypothetical protein